MGTAVTSVKYSDVKSILLRCFIEFLVYIDFFIHIRDEFQISMLISISCKKKFLTHHIPMWRQ